MKVEQGKSNPLYVADLDKKIAVKEKKVAEEAPKPARATDTIEISMEAKMLVNNNVSAKDFEQIRNRIQTNYYNKPEVMQSIAKSVLKDISTETES